MVKKFKVLLPIPPRPPPQMLSREDSLSCISLRNMLDTYKHTLLDFYFYKWKHTLYPVLYLLLFPCLEVSSILAHIDLSHYLYSVTIAQCAILWMFLNLSNQPPLPGSFRLFTNFGCYKQCWKKYPCMFIFKFISVMNSSKLNWWRNCRMQKKGYFTPDRDCQIVCHASIRTPTTHQALRMPASPQCDITFPSVLESVVGWIMTPQIHQVLIPGSCKKLHNME